MSDVRRSKIIFVLMEWCHICRLIHDNSENHSMKISQQQSMINQSFKYAKYGVLFFLHSPSLHFFRMSHISFITLFKIRLERSISSIKNMCLLSIQCTL